MPVAQIDKIFALHQKYIEMFSMSVAMQIKTKQSRDCRHLTVITGVGNGMNMCVGFDMVIGSKCQG